MRSLGVVDLDGLLDHEPGLGQVGGPVEQQLSLQDAVNSLGQGILVAVVAVSHRATDAMSRMQTLVIRRAVLDASIRVVHQGLAGAPRAQRHLQRAAHPFGLQILCHVVAHDLARVFEGSCAGVRMDVHRFRRHRGAGPDWAEEVERELGGEGRRRRIRDAQRRVQGELRRLMQLLTWLRRVEYLFNVPLAILIDRRGILVIC